MFKIYHIICHSNTAYTKYREFICIAENKYNASRMHPSGDPEVEFNPFLNVWIISSDFFTCKCNEKYCKYLDHTWTTNFDDLEIVKLGVTSETSPRVVMSKCAPKTEMQ